MTENLTSEEVLALVRAEVSLDALNEWADKLKTGSPELLEIILDKIEQLQNKIKYMQLMAAK